ncbi:MAG: hypothetical protein SGPRY_000113, partial [Prymnesium sp.]
ELRTYMNGRLCAEVKLQTKAEKVQAMEKAKKKKKATEDAKEGEKETKKVVPVERFCIDPKHLALFAANPVSADGEVEGEAGAERGLSVQFVKLEAKCWGAETVRAQLNELRGQDEEAELFDDSEAARSERLCLQPLYAKPPPIWLHPGAPPLSAPLPVSRDVHLSFAAEFGDSFIAGTALENGSLHVSLECASILVAGSHHSWKGLFSPLCAMSRCLSIRISEVGPHPPPRKVLVLALQRMMHEGGAGCSLPHNVKACLNSATSLLNDAKKLAHQLSHSISHNWQQRPYLARVFKSLGSLEPGGTTLIPSCVGLSPLMFVVQRYLSPEQKKCTFTASSSR